MRFDRRIQCFGAALFVIKGIIWLPIAIYVPALTFNQVTGINIHVITPIVCGICIFYTSVGGLKAVVFSDFVQAFIVFGTMFLVLLKGTFDVGGFGVVWQRNLDSGRIEIPDPTWDPRVRMSMFSVFVGGTMFKLQSLISQPVLQRYLSLPSMAAIKQCMIIFCIGLTLLLGMCCYVGMVIFATYYDCDPLTTKLASAKDQLVPLLVMDVLGQYSGISGLYVSAVFSAALSAMSTLLNSLSAVILEDFAKPFSRNSLTERQTAFIVRAVVVIFGVMAISMVYVVEKLGMVLQLAGTMQSITYGPMMGIFIVGVCMPWINTNSVLTGSAISCATMAVICIRSQIALVNKEYVFAEKPVSIEGCTYEFEHIPILNSTLSDQPTEQERPFYLISWLCYSGLGALLNVIFSHMAILVFGTNKREDIDSSLVAPFLKNYYKEKKKYETVEMFDKIDGKEKS